MVVRYGFVLSLVLVWQQLHQCGRRYNITRVQQGSDTVDKVTIFQVSFEINVGFYIEAVVVGLPDYFSWLIYLRLV